MKVKRQMDHPALFDADCRAENSDHRTGERAERGMHHVPVPGLLDGGLHGRRLACEDVIPDQKLSKL